MRVRIAPNVLLIAPLAVGKDLQAGDVVEVETDTGDNWIKRGWAVLADAPEKEE